MAKLQALLCLVVWNKVVFRLYSLHPHISNTLPYFTESLLHKEDIGFVFSNNFIDILTVDTGQTVCSGICCNNLLILVLSPIT